MKKLFILTALALGLHINASAQKTATISISRATKYQYIDGFGGTGMNGQWGDVFTQAKVNMLWGKGDDQIGLNIMRIRVNPNESNWGEYGNAVKWARKINPDVTVFATPWTPPKKYKKKVTEKYQNEFGTWVWPLYEHSWGGQGSNGSTILDDSIPAYANFLERYRAAMEKKGCPVDIISIQNECDYTPTATDNGVEHASYESCIFSPTQMAKMVKAARAAVDPKCKIMGPETFGWGQANYNNTLIKNQDAVDNIDIYGNHLYGSNDLSFVNNVTKKTGKHMWMTEYLIDYNTDASKGTVYSGGFSDEYEMVKSLESAMANGYNGYVYYNMLNDFFACNHGGSETTLWKRAYVFSHYAKYATGMTRCRSVLSGTYSSNLIGGSTYTSEGGDTISTFILNPTTDKYTYTIAVPIEANKVTAIVTGETVNAKKIDLTSDFNPTTKRIKATLLPGMFYTFVFEKTENQDVELASSPKISGNGNPINPYSFMADPTAIEYNGRLYVYGTNDQQEFDNSNGLLTNTYGNINQLVCMSTADLCNWTNHGIIDVKAASPWIYTSWAPSIVSREESDGKTHFYMYFTNSAGGIGVLTATSPTGPWTDPLGKALIDSKTAGIGTIGNIIDPGAAINPNTGEAYLTFGGGDIKGSGTTLMPGNARIVKLGSDMISLDGDIKTISAPCHFEANELNFIGSKWVYSYCTRWTQPTSTEWKTISSSIAMPGACTIVYMTATDPMADNWSYKGQVLANPGTLGFPYGNNHSHLQKFGSSYYMLFHSQYLEDKLGFSGGYRNLHVQKVTVLESTAKMTSITTSALTTPAQLTASRINAYAENPASMMNNGAGIKIENTSTPGSPCVLMDAGDWTEVYGINFTDTVSSAADVISLDVEGTGTIEVRLGSIDGECVGTASFATNGTESIKVPLTQSISDFQKQVYFVCTSGSGVKFYNWKALSGDDPDAITSASRTSAVPSVYYTPSGVRINAPQQGLNIIKYSDNSVRKIFVK